MIFLWSKAPRNPHGAFFDEWSVFGVTGGDVRGKEAKGAMVKAANVWLQNQLSFLREILKEIQRVDAMFFSVYTPENYYPGRFEIKNTFRVVNLAVDQIKRIMRRSGWRSQLLISNASIRKVKWRLPGFLRRIRSPRRSESATCPTQTWPSIDAAHSTQYYQRIYWCL